MARTIWLALVFLIGICGLAAVKLSIAQPAKQQAAFGDVAENSLAKSDKLVVEDIPEKKIIRSVAIEPLAAASKPKKATKIINRHWQDGYAKTKAGNHHRHLLRKYRVGLKAKPRG